MLSSCGLSSESDQTVEENSQGNQEGTTDEIAIDSEYTIQFAHVVNPSTAKGQAADYFAERLEEQTDGRIAVTVYPDSQLGSDREITEQIQSGTIQMNAPFTGVMPAFVPQYQVYDLPYLFETRKMAYTMSNGELGEMMDDYLLEAGLRGLGFWDGGFKQLTTSTHAIESIEDLSGLTMRVSQSPLLMSQFQSWGATGVSVDFSELYTSLQQGTVDGQENPLSNIVSQNLYEAQSFLTYSDHGYMGYVLMISDSFYQDLPGDLQVIIEEVADETTEWQFQQSLASDAPMLKRKKTGIEINELSEEVKFELREASETVYDEFVNSVEGAEDMLQLFD
ncbi:LOW QUALITY PROTEIN: TRAP-type C4-dicarboxylate transport system, periplasmic component [Geomicrobium sp. JCM 19039]|nr:LOW QUALITY PROTEIN: TRAP-type C4-dicarboxylate transport system, periplasmic component [Geomicrobium sp. JCM 19039]